MPACTRHGASVHLTRVPVCALKLYEYVFINCTRVSSQTMAACARRLCQFVLVTAAMCACHLCQHALINCASMCSSTTPVCVVITAIVCACHLCQRALVIVPAQACTRHRACLHVCLTFLRQLVLINCTSVRLAIATVCTSHGGKLIEKLSGSGRQLRWF